MKRYEVLLLDADETLFDFRKAEREALRRVMESHGFPFNEAILQRYREHNEGLWRKVERGEITKDQLELQRFESLFREFGLRADPAQVGREEYPAELAKGTFLLPGTKEAVEALSKQSTLYLTTNGITRVQKARLRDSEIAPYIKGIFVSEEAGAAKPNIRYFEYVFEKIGAEQFRGAASLERDVLIVGDSLTSDIAGGNNAGIDTCWFNPAGKKLPEGVHVTWQIRSLTELVQ